MNILVNIKNPGSGMYYHRVRTPLEALCNKEGWAAVETETKTEEGKIYYAKMSSYPKEYLSQFQYVYVSRSLDWDNDQQKEIDHIKDCGCKLVVDIDDYWHLDKYHHEYHRYNKTKVPQKTEQLLNEADLVTTPTEVLTEKCREFNPNSHTLKTCIDTSHPQWQSKSISSSLMRFGWIGGIHHERDLTLLQNEIKDVHENLTGYQICLGGFSTEKKYVYTTKGTKQYREEHLTNPFYLQAEKVFTCNYRALEPHYRDWLLEYNRSLPDHISYYQPYRRLWDRDVNNYGKLYDEIDVLLVPLFKGSIFNRYKSELKLIEAGTKGKMAIVSRTEPYTIVPDSVVHFVNPGDVGGWYQAIKYCLDNPNYVKEKALALNEYIKINYNLEAENEKRKKLFTEL